MTSATDPSYADLPVRPGAPAGASWGVWERQDLGALNRLNRETVLAAVGAVHVGAVYSLNLEVNAIDPPLFGRTPARHVVSGPEEALARDSLIEDWNTQSSTQLDGFRHIRDESGFYGGLPGDAHGLEAWAAHGIVARCVLVDVARHLEATGERLGGAARPIDVPLLEETLAAQDAELAPGDFLLVRTGWLAWYRDADTATRARVARREELQAPGLLAATETARWLWDQKVCGVAADNPSCEVWPLGTGSTEDESLHVALLARLGIPIGELWDLDDLAGACAADRRWEALLIASPLALEGGCAGPANAVAVR